MVRASIGVIGGSGLYEIEGLTSVQEISPDTPFGYPSDAITVGILDGTEVAFLPRHGRGHRLLPSEIPSRANVFAMKSLGVRQIISVSAVGSLREDYRPMDIVIPDQIFDRTKGRPSTFFGDGIVGHVSFAHPFCAAASVALREASQGVVPRTHEGGTYVCMEGPAFSTAAESHAYRRLGFDLIGMTALPEAKLAREAGICYALLAQVTDYDCWHPDHDSVTSDMVMSNVARNVATAKEIIGRVLPLFSTLPPCECTGALVGAIATATGSISREARERLAPLLEGGIVSH